jgi:signal peptidase I
VGVRTVAARVAAVALAAVAAVWAASSYRAVYVGGGSMAPALVQGDFVVVRRGVAGVREGDVVLAAKEGWPAGVLHRVVVINADDTLVLRGDSNPTPDRDPAGPASVLGVVTCSVPTGRVLAAVEGAGR